MSPLVDELIKALRILPGIGPKSAQRCALHLLQRQREGGLRLARVLDEAMRSVDYCSRCRIFCEQSLCELCSDERRDPALLCVVTSALDVLAMQQSGSYQGQYFVLAGSLSPLAGLGAAEVGIPFFQKRLEDPQLREVILATASDLEGEATAYYLAGLARQKKLLVTRLARGIPVGGALEHVDSRTLGQALELRRSW